MKKLLGVLLMTALSVSQAMAQQKPSPVAIWCQDGSGNFAPCQSGPTAVTSADNIANATASIIHGFGFMYDGTNWDRVRGDSTNGLLVNLGANNDVTVTSGSIAATQSGTWNIGSITTLPALAAGTNNIGDVDVLTINGQAPAFGTGTRSAATQRVTIATDDVVPAAQSGTWNITNISGTVSLPTGASTAAKQPALGTAGSASSDVITVQGITSMTPLKTDGSGVTQPVSGTVSITANSAVNVAQMNGVATSMGNGASGTGTQRVTIASDSTGTVAATQSGTWTVQPGNTANTTPWLTSPIPATSGGTSTCYLSSAATTNSTNCKASAGQIYGYDLINTTQTLYYLRLYNLSSAPTCSSATGFIRSIPIPPAGAAGQAGGIARSSAVGQAYGTGIGFCLTGGGSSTDNTSAGTGVHVAIDYK